MSNWPPLSPLQQDLADLQSELEGAGSLVQLSQRFVDDDKSYRVHWWGLSKHGPSCEMAIKAVLQFGGVRTSDSHERQE